MSEALAQVSGSEEVSPGKRLIRAVLAGTFARDDLPLASSWADSLTAALKEASAGHAHSVGILIDISKLETYTDPTIITLLSGLMKRDKLYVRRTATFGGNEAHEMVQQVVSGMADRDNLRNFRTEKEALKWLSE